MKRMRNTKTMLVLAMVMLVLACAVGGTIAFLIDTTDTVTNTFTPVRVTCQVVEGNFTEGVSTTKENVRIKNTGNTNAWIRATVVANWVDGNGKIVAPCAVDLGEVSDWTKKQDGYYYYDKIVTPTNMTSDLITRYTPTGGPEGTHLEMTIVCQAVQSNLGNTADAAFTKAATGIGNQD